MAGEYLCPVCGHQLRPPPSTANWGIDAEGHRLPTMVCPVDGYFGRLPEGTAVAVELIDEI